MQHSWLTLITERLYLGSATRKLSWSAPAFSSKYRPAAGNIWAHLRSLGSVRFLLPVSSLWKVGLFTVTLLSCKRLRSWCFSVLIRSVTVETTVLNKRDHPLGNVLCCVYFLFIWVKVLPEVRKSASQWRYLHLYGGELLEFQHFCNLDQDFLQPILLWTLQRKAQSQSHQFSL